MRDFGLLTNGYLYPHRHRKATACPGKHTMEVWDSFYFATLERPVAPLPPQGADRLLPTQRLSPGRHLLSQNGEFMLLYQTDGNLVVYNKALQPLWNSKTTGYSAGAFVMQSDGNAVIYNWGGVALWSTGTHGSKNAWCIMQNDGNFVVYHNSRALWWSKR
jgi:hypothetical protein